MKDSSLSASLNVNADLIEKQNLIKAKIINKIMIKIYFSHIV